MQSTWIGWFWYHHWYFFIALGYSEMHRAIEKTRFDGDICKCFVGIWIVKCVWLECTWWCHHMETISLLLAFLCGEFTGHRWIPRTNASVAELWCFLWSPPEINGWVNNGETGDFRRNRAHYNVTLMEKKQEGGIGSCMLVPRLSVSSNHLQSN